MRAALRRLNYGLGVGDIARDHLRSPIGKPTRGLWATGEHADPPSPVEKSPGEMPAGEPGCPVTSARRSS